MALVHDLAECLVGDITPFCGVSREEKHKREMVSEQRQWLVITEARNSNLSTQDNPVRGVEYNSQSSISY